MAVGEGRIVFVFNVYVEVVFMRKNCTLIAVYSDGLWLADLVFDSLVYAPYLK
jgi:hypothetical protein